LEGGGTVINEGRRMTGTAGENCVCERLLQVLSADVG
jgi:hypothetical protein